MQTSSQRISQVVLRSPDGSLDVVAYQMYADGSITKQTEGSWSIYDQEISSKDDLSSPKLKILLLENTSSDFKHIAIKYLGD